jgi:hypothetical protein
MRAPCAPEAAMIYIDDDARERILAGGGNVIVYMQAARGCG